MKATGGRESQNPPQGRQQPGSYKNNRAPAGVLPIVYRGLVIFLLVLGIILIGGTVYGVFLRAVPPVHIETEIKQESGPGQTFAGIGRIRASTADPQPGTVILFVSFIYYPDDKAFSEELALRIGDFRGIIAGYISSFSAGELQNQGEESIKTELLRRFNAILLLGQIETLFFSDFMII